MRPFSTFEAVTTKTAIPLERFEKGEENAITINGLSIFWTISVRTFVNKLPLKRLSLNLSSFKILKTVTEKAGK
jgi:hypothetical protein